MTTPNPAAPEPGASVDAPIQVLAAARRELAGAALVLLGTVGFLVTLGFLVSPLASVAAICVLIAVVGLGMCTGQVDEPADTASGA